MPSARCAQDGKGSVNIHRDLGRLPGGGDASLIFEECIGLGVSQVEIKEKALGGEQIGSGIGHRFESVMGGRAKCRDACREGLGGELRGSLLAASARP